MKLAERGREAPEGVDVLWRTEELVRPWAHHEGLELHIFRERSYPGPTGGLL